MIEIVGEASTSRINEANLASPFDLLIVGAGINGAGIARDAALRGLKVLLLDKGDFASGCSAHSTRLIHGGLRYLEYFEFPLVYESLQEREILLESYPHLVQPISLMIPHYDYSRVPFWKLRLGMCLYDLLSWTKSLDSHRVFSSSELEQQNPDLNQNKLEGAVSYFDGQVPFAERIVLENVLDAKKHGAQVYNYAEVTNIEHQNGKASALEFKDLLTAETYKVQAKAIINVAGPWVDLVNKKVKGKDFTREIGASKGSHIVLDDFVGAPKGHGIYVEARADNRPFFILPFKIGENKTKYLVGTTDIFTREDLDQLKVSDQEIEYLLSELNSLSPRAGLTKAHVQKTFVGVRPLPHIANPKSAGAVTRRHFVNDHSSSGIKNYYSIVGGKLTTFRNLAREFVDKLSSETSLTRKQIINDFTHHSKQASNKEAFIGFMNEKSEEYAFEYGIDQRTAQHLIKLYGLRAKEVLDICKEDESHKNRLDANYFDIKAQVIYAVRHEMALTVDDILHRRLSLGLLQNDFSDKVLAEVQSLIDACL